MCREEGREGHSVGAAIAGLRNGSIYGQLYIFIAAALTCEDLLSPAPPPAPPAPP